ncbi:MAG: class C sortase [Clostridia bacterium]
MKKKIFTIILILLFLLGLVVLLYPSISNFYNEQVNSYVVSNYSDIVENANAEEYEQIMQEAKDYNEELHSTSKNFISGDPQDSEYINTLDVYNGMMGYIEIEKLGIKLSIYHGTGEDVLQSKIGHLEGSSLPTGEVGNNTVLTGHTGLPSAELFTDLDQMEIGDTFNICILDEVFTYQVFNIVVVEPYQVDELEPIDGKDIVTLVTCTPYGVNSHRLLVQGEQIELIEEEIVVETNSNIDDFDIVKFAPIVVVPIIIILIILIIISHKRDKKHRYKK